MVDDQKDSNPPALLLLHGGGLNRAMWMPQIKRLGKDYKIRAIDLPGHGNLCDIPFTLDEAVRRTSQAIAQEDAGPIVVAGLSLGGYVAIAHAARHAEQVAGLVLSGCCVQYFGLIGVLARANVVALKFTPQSIFGKMQRKMIEAVADSETAEGILQCHLSLHGGRSGLWEVIGVDFAKMLENCRVPILLLNGEEDTLNRKYEPRYLRASNRTRRDLLLGCGHLCSLEQPEAFTAALRRFAEELRLPCTAPTVPKGGLV